MLKFISIVCFLLINCGLFAQVTTHYSASHAIEVGALISTKQQTPFWLRANQYGTVPLSAPMGTMRLSSQGEWQPDSSARYHKWIIQYGGYIVGNIGQSSDLLLPEAYVKAGIGKVYLRVGRQREIIGLGDSTLTSGFFTWSQNALPLTKLQIGTNGFAPIGFTKGLIAINFLFAHGWFPNTSLVQNSLLHQKALYGRIGKPNWNINLYGGLVHNVQWGGRSNFVRQDLTINGSFPSSFNDYLHLLAAKKPKGKYGKYPSIDSLNQVGNHLGSIDIGIELKIKSLNILTYYQHPFEDKSGLALVNFPDGLYGIRLKSDKQNTNSTFRIKQVTFEYLTTRNQSNSVSTKLSNRYFSDDYFNHSQYIDGWTIDQRVIGTPFITRKDDTNYKSPSNSTSNRRVINNNTVEVFHFGLLNELPSGARIETKLSHSANFGRAADVKKESINQFSGIVTTYIPSKWFGGLDILLSVALDNGKLYDNSLGSYVGIKKIW